MKRRHFESLQPVCPICRNAGSDGQPSGEFPLQLASVEREVQDTVIEGILHCSNTQCLREYPIIDAIPLLIPDLTGFVAAQILPLLARQDLSAATESLLGDASGPGSAYDVLRQQVSSYVWDHYAEFDPQEETSERRPGSGQRVLEGMLASAGPIPPGPVLDLGCSVGRHAFGLAERRNELVLGIDLHFAMLRIAAGVLSTGSVRYQRRRLGLVYDRREFPVDFPRSENVDFWACDIIRPPFRDDTFALAAGLNVLDCVSAPRDFLGELSRILLPGGKALLACPYDWSSGATHVTGWLGGHSQRGSGSGESSHLVRQLLTPGAHRHSVAGLTLEAELDDIPWFVRLHDRSTMEYRVHPLIARAEG